MSPNESIMTQRLGSEHEDEDCMMNTSDPMKPLTSTCSSAELICVAEEAVESNVDESSISELDVPALKSASSDELDVDSLKTAPSDVEPVNIEKIQRKKSILRKSDDEIPIRSNRRSCRVLPPPIAVRQMSCPSDLNSARPKRSVSFATVDIREYDQTIGDHPSVSYGAPIALDWNYEELGSLDLEDYELNRGKRRSASEFMLNYFVRTNKLMHNFGFSKEELKKAQKEAEKAKFQRAVTKYFLRYSIVEDVVTSGARKVKRVMKGTRAASK